MAAGQPPAGAPPEDAWAVAPGVLALVPEINGMTDPWRIEGPVDALLFQRGWFVRWDGALAAWTAALRRAGTALVLDTDDNLWDPRGPDRAYAVYGESGRPSLYAKGWMEQQRRGRVACLRAMDGVTVSTPALAAAMRPYTRPGTPIAVVPNAISPARYLAARGVRAGDGAGHRVTVGWAGTSRLRSDLEELARVWGRLARRYPAVDFVTVGVAQGAFDGAVPAGRLLDLGPQPPLTYPAGLARLDVGCCPLAPGWFNECKSPQKAWELALCGAAVVASPTVYADDPGFVAHGGLLAGDAAAWEHHLSRLIESAEERRARQEALTAWVLREHTLEANLWRWPSAWRTIVGQAGRAPTAPPAPRGTWAAYQAERAARKAAAKRERRAQRAS